MKYQLDILHEIDRRPALRVGIVKELDASLCRVRVTFSDLDQMTSYWLAVVTPKTQDDKFYWMPDVGEQVVCLMDARYEAGAVLGAIYSRADATPVASADKFHVAFSDRASFEYDRHGHKMVVNFPDSTTIVYDAAAHSLAVSGGGGATVTVNAPGGITLGAGQSQIRIQPSGVSITPPLPTTSTVAR